MFVLGLTGSIGMGKSTSAAMFRQAGIPVHDADAAVHALYGGAAVPLLQARFPSAIQNGAVDRARLSATVLNDPAAMRDLEAIVHPLVREAERAFLLAQRAQRATLVVLDIPLLFETGGAARCDAILVVTAPADIQRARVMARPGMSAGKFEAILARQVPDAQKRARAHFIVDTSHGLAAARADIGSIIAALAGRSGDASRWIDG
jgi:dephospho-CoA kinase